jgi:hypothetical protein
MNNRVWVVTLFFVVAIIVAVWLIFFSTNSQHNNVGYLLVGALISALAVPLTEWLKKPVQIRILAQGLYVELADRVARCCFDYESPWSEYKDKLKSGMTRDYLGKFAPFPPVIYQATASQISILDGDAPQRLIQFYCRLAAWQRDIEATSTLEGGFLESAVDAKDVQRLAYRLYQTLEAGQLALCALAPMVKEHEKLNADAIAAHDKFRKEKTSGTLHDRINKWIRS